MTLFSNSNSQYEHQIYSGLCVKIMKLLIKMHFPAHYPVAVANPYPDPSMQRSTPRVGKTLTEAIKYEELNVFTFQTAFKDDTIGLLVRMR